MQDYVSSSYWNHKRQKIYDWMTANGQQSFAELYRGATVNLYQKTPGHTRFVAHAVRDLMNGMAACKLGRKRSQAQYTALVEQLRQLWESHGLPNGPETLQPEGIGTHTHSAVIIPKDVTAHIQMLLREHEEGRRRSDESPFLFFQAFVPAPDAYTAMPPAYGKMWKTLRDWFMEQCHENGKLPDQETLNEIEGKFVQVEDILLSVGGLSWG